MRPSTDDSLELQPAPVATSRGSDAGSASSGEDDEVTTTTKHTTQLLKAGTSTSIDELPGNNHGTKGLRRRQRAAPGVSAGDSFLRSVGLKVISSRKQRGPKTRSRDVEPPKEVETRSMWIAVVRTTVHILPVLATLFVICFNVFGFLNGPEITSSATFFLQLEMAIVSSLGMIAIDLVRHHLLNDGINFGLLAAGISFSQLSWLWSTDYLSTFPATIPLRSKALLLSVLTLCCLLAATVGPSSALLFVPTQVWLPSASTDYYIAGTEEQLHPLELTADHAGPKYCNSSPLYSNKFGQCLYAGWSTLVGQATLTDPVRPGWGLFFPGHRASTGIPPRVMSGTTPDPIRNYTTVSDSFARTITATAARNMDELTSTWEWSWQFAKGRNRRLRDFIGGGGGYAVTWDWMPTTRTVCGAPKVIENGTTTLEFPILFRESYWRHEQTRGPVQEVDISTLKLGEGWRNLNPADVQHAQARAEFVAQPPGLGNATSAALIFLSQDLNMTVARACTIDSRWGEGENLSTGDAFLFHYESQVGKQAPPEGDKYQFTNGIWWLDKHYLPYYSPSINMSKEWFDGWVLPMSEETAVGSNFTQTNFEALLNRSSLSNPVFTKNEADKSTVLLEYFINIFITDALSRIGWALQTKTDNSIDLNPLLHDGPEILDDRFLNGKQLWAPPPFPHVTRHFRSFKYGTAWYLKDFAQYVSVAILSIHMAMAVVHTAMKIWTKKTSEAWDSVNELVALGYNSVPQDGALENCSGGITAMGTLTKVVRVGEVSDGRGDAKVELVVCDGTQGGKMVGKVVAGAKYK